MSVDRTEVTSLAVSCKPPALSFRRADVEARHDSRSCGAGYEPPKRTDIALRHCPYNGYYLVTRSLRFVLGLSILYEQIAWPTLRHAACDAAAHQRELDGDDGTRYFHRFRIAAALDRNSAPCPDVMEHRVRCAFLRRQRYGDRAVFEWLDHREDSGCIALGAVLRNDQGLRPT